MPRLRAKHRTELQYAGPVSESINELRMTPRDVPGLTVLSAETKTEPPVELVPSIDAFGNTRLWFQIATPHDRMVVESSAVVDVDPRVHPSAGGWDDLADPALQDEMAEFLAPSRFIRWTAPIMGLATELGLPEDGELADWLAALERGVNESIVYAPGATTVDTPVEEVVHARRGVCQDMAHLAIAICRHRGVPARYVSGWLHQPGHDGPAESHAWLEAYLGEGGWLEMDPTHPGMDHLDYVRVAMGRDYADVPPIRGSYVGPPTTRMEVHVDVDEMHPGDPDEPGGG